MVPCSQCGHPNPPGAQACSKCGAGGDSDATMISGHTVGPPPKIHSLDEKENKSGLGADSDATMISGHTIGPPPKTHAPDDGEDRPALGTVLAERYQVIDILGVGGMGSVYKAFDRRLTRVVALKTIHPQLAATPVMMKRFKQEVLLAQKITHKNVVRIFDIGEDHGTAFLTMDFIEGVSLKDSIQERGKFPATEAVATIREVARALEAAHGEGVVHRDLKPQNIMIEKNGHIVVMDFGIARSAEHSGATQTGSLLGTPDYMSPEQARMEEVDSRSDIFSLGLIFYELLTGKLAFGGKTVVETMFIRTKERAIPPAEIERSIPAGANDIVVKCLEPEKEKRYQSVTELLTDLENFDPSRKVGAGTLVKSRLKKISRYRNWIAAAVVILVLSIAALILRDRYVPAPPAVRENVSVFIADFTNHTGNAVFDNALEPIIKLALEQAGFVSAFDRRQASSLGVPAAEGRIDEAAAQKIAVGQGLDFVVSGSLEEQDSRVVISIKTKEAVTGKEIQSSNETASNKDQVLYVATKLAGQVLKALGDDTSESVLRFNNENLSATSLEAVREYATAMDLLSNGKHADALKSFSKAVDLDANFGLAYAGMAVTSRNLGNQQDAERYIKTALEKIDRMTDREKYRTRAYSFSLSGNREKCVEEYSTLIGRFPADVAAHNNLANCLTQTRNMPRAIEEVRRAIAILPKRPLYRNNLALYASYGGDFKTGEQEARAVQVLDPSYPTGFVALAFAQLGQANSADARDTYQKLEKINASVAKSGLADVAIYEGRYAEAVRILEQGAAEDLSAGSKDRAALKLSALAYTRLLQGEKQNAVAAAEKALANSGTVKIRFLSGMIFGSAGQEARAKTIIAGLAAELQPEPRAYAKIIEGEIALQAGNPGAAIPIFSDANKLLDTWIGRFEIGKAYLATGTSFTEAQSEFDTCLRRRGEALALFLDESPTYGHFPLVYYYLGRALEGMKSPGSSEQYRNYLSIREKAGEDVLLADARKRIK